MTQNIEYRLYHPGDEEGIVKLLSIAFTLYSKNKSPIDYWKWKYLDSPMGSIIRVADMNGVVVGVGHGILSRVKIGEDIVIGHLSGEVTTHPDYRGMGIYSKITGMSDNLRKERGVQFHYYSSSNPIILNTKKIEERITFPQIITYMARIHDVSLHLKNRPWKNPFFVELGFRVFKLLNRLRNVFSGNISPTSVFFIEEAKMLDPNVNSLWERVKGEYNFIFEKNQRYLNWRYADPRGGENHIFQARNGEDILGLLFLQIREEDEYREGFISDILTTSNRLDIADALLRRACEYIDSHGMNVVYYEVVKGHHYYKVASKYGFIDSRSGPNIKCLTSEERYKIIKDSPPEKVYFNYGDLF